MKRHRRILIPETAAEWELFTSDPKSELAAMSITDNFCQAIDFWLDGKFSLMDLERSMSRVMSQWRGQGATDTEPRSKLMSVLDKLQALTEE